MDNLIAKFVNTNSIEIEDIKTIFDVTKMNRAEENPNSIYGDNDAIKTAKKIILPRSEKQKIYVDALKNHKIVMALNNIKVPTLVMGGDNDVIKPEHSLLIHQNIPNSYLWIAPNSGHSAAVVYKDDFNKNVHQFFKTPFRKIESAARFF